MYKRFLLLILFVSISITAQNGWNFDELKSFELTDINENVKSSIQIVESDNSLIAFYCSGDSILTIKSTDGGESWGESNFITEAYLEDGEYFDFSAVETSTGKLVLTFSVFGETGTGIEPLKVTYSEDSGATWSDPANVKGSMRLTYSGNLILAKNGTLIVTGRNGYLFTSSDDGLTWNPLKVSFNAEDIVSYSEDGLVAFYVDEGDIYSVMSEDFGSSWSEENLLVNMTDKINNPEASISEDGKIYLSYELKASTEFQNIYQSDIYYTTSSDTGEAWEESIKFSSFLGDDLNQKLSDNSGNPIITFLSTRWNGTLQPWFGKLGITEDTDSPPVIFDFAENNKQFKVYCGSSNGIQNVSLLYSINDGTEQIAEMFDDGNHGDENSEDNIYGVSIDAVNPPYKLKVSFEITDNSNNSVTYEGFEKYYHLEVKNTWMNVGSYQNWFSSLGSEIEHGFVAQQQYGMQWPAEYEYQNMQSSRSLWIGSKNFYDRNGEMREHKVVHVGPRVDGQEEFFPVEFKTISKFEKPKVFVDGELSSNKETEIDSVDPNLFCDRLIYNKTNTELGLTMEREIFQFSQESHDDYIVTKYTFTNTGNTDYDSDIERADSLLKDVYVFLQNRIAISQQTRYLIGNSSGWGVNTMLDSRGDGIKDDTDNPDNLRFQYAWHGYYPAFTEYDNIGAPIFHPDGPGYISESDTVGRLGSAQFPGMMTLHADNSAEDNSDNPNQPSTTWYTSSDADYNFGNSSTNNEKMTAEYAVMSKGHPEERHADKIEPEGNFTDPSNNPSSGSTNGSGYSMANGYGPYDIPFGESITIIVVEGANGLSRDKAIEIGNKYKNEEITAVEKNEWVLTGKDSLINTFTKAKANYDNEWNIPQPPMPPKNFSVQASDEGVVNISWDVFNTDNLTGFEIYRSISFEEKGYDIGTWSTKYDLIAEVNKDSRSFVDSTAAENIDYYYYIQAVGDENNNDQSGLTENGALKSSRFYTQTYAPINLVKTGINPNINEFSYKLYNNYPNPFNPTTNIQYSIKTEGHVKLTVFNILGQKVAELVNKKQQRGTYRVNWNASSFASGVYIYRLVVNSVSNENFVKQNKMLLLK